MQNISLRRDVRQHVKDWLLADEEERDALLDRWTEQGPWRAVVKCIEYVGFLKIARRTGPSFQDVEFSIMYAPGKCITVPFERCELVGEER